MVNKGGCLKPYLCAIMRTDMERDDEEWHITKPGIFGARAGCGTPSCAHVSSVKDSSYMCVYFKSVYCSQAKK